MSNEKDFDNSDGGEITATNPLADLERSSVDNPDPIDRQHAACSDTLVTTTPHPCIHGQYWQCSVAVQEKSLTDQAARLRLADQLQAGVEKIVDTGNEKPLTGAEAMQQLVDRGIVDKDVADGYSDIEADEADEEPDHSILPVKSPFTMADGQSDGKDTLAKSLAGALTGQNRTDKLHQAIKDRAQAAAEWVLSHVEMHALAEHGSGDDPEPDLSDEYTTDDICREISSGRLHMEDVAREFIRELATGVKRWERDRGLRKDR